MDLRARDTEQFSAVLDRAADEYESSDFARLVIRCATEVLQEDERFLAALPKKVAVAVFVSQPNLVLSPNFATLGARERHDIAEKAFRTFGNKW